MYKTSSIRIYFYISDSTYLSDNVIKIIKDILNFYKLVVRFFALFFMLSGLNIAKV